MKPFGPLNSSDSLVASASCAQNVALFLQWNLAEACHFSCHNFYRSKKLTAERITFPCL